MTELNAMMNVVRRPELVVVHRRPTRRRGGLESYWVKDEANTRWVEGPFTNHGAATQRMRVLCREIEELEFPPIYVGVDRGSSDEEVFAISDDLIARTAQGLFRRMVMDGRVTMSTTYGTVAKPKFVLQQPSGDRMLDITSDTELGLRSRVKSLELVLRGLLDQARSGRKVHPGRPLTEVWYTPKFLDRVGEVLDGMPYDQVFKRPIKKSQRKAIQV